MPTLLAAGELTPPALAARGLRLAPFKHVSTDQYRELLVHLLALDHVQKTEEGGLIVGLAEEHITGIIGFVRYSAKTPNSLCTQKASRLARSSILHRWAIILRSREGHGKS